MNSNLETFKEQWKALEEQQQENLKATASSSDYYFNSYAHFGIHEEMLKDSVRTGAYQKAICDNPHLFKDKTVLDVGSGTGILSMFAVKAGAKHVYAIECSDIADVSRKIIKANKMDDKITIVHKKAEEIEDELTVDNVDIIISEWMGYFLLYESMLDTVIYCRDRWLKKGGLIFPDKATLYLAGIEDGEYRHEKIECWNNVYGLDYSCVAKSIIQEPLVDTVQEQAICTNEAVILALDLNTCTVGDVDFAAEWKLKLTRKDFVHALIAYFDVEFSCCHKPIRLSTAPINYTHWKQTVFYLDQIITGAKGEEIRGMIAVRKNALNHRDLDIKLFYDFQGELAKISVPEQYFRIR